MAADRRPPQTVADFAVVRKGFDREEVSSLVGRLDAELRVTAADRDAAAAQAVDLGRQLDQARASLDALRAKVDQQAQSSGSVDGLSDRMARMLRLAQDEASEIRARAEQEAADVRSVAEQDADDAAREHQRRLQLLDEHRDELDAQHAERVAAGEAEASRQLEEAQARGAEVVADAEAEAARLRAEHDGILDDARAEAAELRATVAAEVAELRATADAEVAQQRATADAEVAEQRATAEAEIAAAVRADTERATAAAERGERLRAEQDAEHAAAQAEVAELRRAAQAEVDRLDAETAARRAAVEDDFEIAMGARRSEALAALQDQEQTSKAEAERRVHDATVEARRRLTRANDQASTRVAEANRSLDGLRDARARIGVQLASARSMLDDLTLSLAPAAAELAPIEPDEAIVGDTGSPMLEASQEEPGDDGSEGSFVVDGTDDVQPEARTSGDGGEDQPRVTTNAG